MRPSRSTYNPNGIAERTVLEAKVLEFGPTPFAIYPSAVAAMRSLTDEVMIERLAADPDRFAALAERAGVAPLLDPMMSNAAAIKSVVDGGVDPDTVTSMVINDANSSTNVDVPQTTTTITMPPAIRAVDDDPVTARRYARAAEYIGTTVWALTPTALATVLTIIGERVMGHRPSNEEILERIGGRPRADVADEPPTPDSPVRVIDIAGPIVPHAGMMDNTSSSMRSVEGIQSDLRAAVADETVKQIMLHIDSPGGSAELIPEIAAEIRDARKSKPITAMANTMAGSGAYWIASAADEIVVTPSGSVGSIGVYGAHEDISALQEREGVRTTLVSAGKFKVEGNPFEPLTEDARAEMQRRVDAIYKTFVKEVATGRGITAKKVEDDFGQGRMVMAVDAVERGMADRVATFTQTLARLEKAASSSATPTATRAAEHANAPEPHAATTPDATELHSDVPDLYGRKERPSWQL
jgi:signal peptide peptidase SppA